MPAQEDESDPPRSIVRECCLANGVLRALLYCHGLIIEDPVAMAADMYLSTSPDARHLARMAVEAATSSMVEISELLDAEVVRTFSAGGDIDPIYQLSSFFDVEEARRPSCPR